MAGKFVKRNDHPLDSLYPKQYNSGFGIIYPMTLNLPLNKETKPNWSLSDSKFPQISMIFQDNLIDFNSTVV